jgi:demethylmenaquinone methyltransferase/2-methoxy-6-polyprenyl-1,4-benzoquinol methylase
MCAAPLRRQPTPGDPAAARPASGPALPLDKQPEAIRRMFARVAPVYDLLNHVLSASLDHAWRRASARAVRANLDGPALPGPALDLCCGTGDQAIALHNRGVRVAAADFCLPMVAIARHKFARRDRPRPAPMVADALALPFASQTFAATTVSFGLRNVVDLDAGLREIARVLQPDGRVSFLEIAVPRRQPLRALYLFYFQQLLPRIGRLVSRDPGAYSYLPASVLQFPHRDALVARMHEAGLADGAWRDLAGGIVCLYTARRTP